MDYLKPQTTGSMCIPVLEFLNGLPWDLTTKNMLAALRPSEVRECRDGMKLDARLWRVTVWLKGSAQCPVIESIEQEVNVGCDPDFLHGHDLETSLLKMGMRELR